MMVSKVPVEREWLWQWEPHQQLVQQRRWRNIDSILVCSPPQSPGWWQWNSSWGLCWWWQQTGQMQAGRRWGRGGRISDWSGQCRHWTICNVEPFWAHSDRTDYSAQTEELKKMRWGKIFLGFKALPLYPLHFLQKINLPKIKWI